MKTDVLKISSGTDRKQVKKTQNTYTNKHNMFRAEKVLSKLLLQARSA